MTGKWNPSENRAVKNASAVKTALNTMIEKLYLFLSNRINSHHRHGSNAAIYQGLLRTIDFMIRGHLFKMERKIIRLCSLPPGIEVAHVSILLPLFLVNIADNLIGKMLPHSHEFSQFSLCHTLSTLSLTPPPPLKFLFSAFLFLCLSPFSVPFSCYTCGLSPPGSLTT